MNTKTPLKRLSILVGALALFALPSVTLAGKFVIVAVDPGSSNQFFCISPKPVVLETGTPEFRDAVSQDLGVAATLRSIGCTGAHIKINPNIFTTD